CTWGMVGEASTATDVSGLTASASCVVRSSLGQVCWLSSMRRFHTHWATICQHSWRKARPRTPAVGILFLIFVGQTTFKAAAPKVQIEHIAGPESLWGQGGVKQFIHLALAQDAHRWAGRGGHMPGD